MKIYNFNSNFGAAKWISSGSMSRMIEIVPHLGKPNVVYARLSIIFITGKSHDFVSINFAMLHKMQCED